MAGFTTSTHKMHNSNKTALNIGGKKNQVITLLMEHKVN